MKKTVLAVLLATASLAPLWAFASDGTIIINGSVFAPTCIINGGAPNFTRTLPTLSSSTLSTVGSTNGDTSVSINLTGCNPASGGARVFFESGAGVNATSGRLINTGTATNVDVQLAMPDDTPIIVGAASGAQNTGTYTSIVSGAASLNYKARYYSTATTHAAGTVAASVTYAIEYE
ncbi:fimbrial protein [Herbaspirillum rhizosphaerae]|uniref:fimbrial protein n=1 Tax=Herbaspirillum rhizosphaerae TaxID=346179 RepID=UPI00067E5110|nr:fimbrial protein [Herbaspirillum rhizosphaerae]